MSNFETLGKILCIGCREPNVRGSSVRVLDLGPTSGKCHGMESPLSHTRGYPVGLGFRPQESVANLGPPGEIICNDRNEHKVKGPWFESSTWAKLAVGASVHIYVSPLTPFRCNHVTLSRWVGRQDSVGPAPSFFDSGGPQTGVLWTKMEVEEFTDDMKIEFEPNKR